MKNNIIHRIAVSFLIVTMPLLTIIHVYSITYNPSYYGFGDYYYRLFGQLIELIYMALGVTPIYFLIPVSISALLLTPVSKLHYKLSVALNLLLVFYFFVQVFAPFFIGWNNAEWVSSLYANIMLAVTWVILIVVVHRKINAKRNG